MAKKIRFPLEMDDGVEVRDVESLREHFSIPRVIAYAKEGKLAVWLRDRYAIDLAEAVEKIDKDDNEIASKICAVFDIEYNEKVEEDLEKAAERAKRTEMLREYTDDPKYIKEVGRVAFDQDELYDLLDENSDIIYLCGERFIIPISKAGVTYIGINNPVAVVESKVEVDWLEKKIVLKGLTFDEKYQEVIDSAEETKQELYEKLVENLKKYNRTCGKTHQKFGEYGGSYLSFMLSPKDRQAAGETFNKLTEAFSGVKYNIDADINYIRGKLKKMNMIGCANNYLERL